MKAGYIYIANRIKYLNEAITSSRSLKDHSNYPICLITNEELISRVTNNDLKNFDIIIKTSQLENKTYDSKIIGITHSPFEYTIFLDTDTFVCANIDNIFSLLDQFDIACTIEPSIHTSQFAEDKKELKFINLFPELNTGIIAFRKNTSTKYLFECWGKEYRKLKTYFDMPSFREAVLNCQNIKLAILPAEYNFHGFHSFALAYKEIKVIHGRFGERWDTLTLIAEDYEKMLQRAKKMNRIQGKRIFIPYIGFIPASYNLYRLKYKLKKLLGIKLTSKRNTY